MKNVLAYLTEYKAKKAALDKLDEEVKAMKAEIEQYVTTNVQADDKGKYKYTCGQYTVTITPCVKTWVDNAILDCIPEAEDFRKETEYNRTIVK